MTHAHFIRAGLPASVAHLTALAVLDISRNGFGAAGAKTVAKVLARCVNLRSLAHAVGRCMHVGCCYPAVFPIALSLADPLFISLPFLVCPRLHPSPPPIANPLSPSTYFLPHQRGIGEVRR